jgi:hypothetical protein
MPRLLKRWWFWAGAGFMLVAVVAGYLVIPVGEGRISQASCDRLQLGWSPHQVASLLRENEFLGSGRVQEPIAIGLSLGDEDGNRIEVGFATFNGSDQLRLTRKKFVPTNLSFLERVKGRIERRLKAMLP